MIEPDGSERSVGEVTDLEVTIVAIDVGPIGGMERQLTELIQGLLASGHKVTVVSRSCRLPRHPALRWVRVPCPGRPFSIAYPWFFLVGSLLVRLRARGVVHSTGALIFNRTHVTTVHLCHHAIAELPHVRRMTRPGLPYRVNTRVVVAMSALAERWCYRPRRAGCLVAVSGGVASELRRYFPRMAGRTITIANGVDTTEFRPARDDERPDKDALSSRNGLLQALFVGSEWEGKGLRFAIEALVGLPAWRLAVVGNGDIERYKGLARDLDVLKRVNFVGRTRDVAAHYRASDAFVLPTAYESFSLVAYEAAASGLPLLVTRVSGVEDILQDGHNGWFVTRDAEDVRGRLCDLEKDSRRRAEMGAAARKAIMRFTWSEMVARYRSLYREAAA